MDNTGFELQVTSPPSASSSSTNNGRKQSIPAGTPKVPVDKSLGKAPPKPSKSSTLPKHGNTNGNSNVEKGKVDKAVEAKGPAKLMFNVGYFKSWQAWLKMTKTLCLIAMLVSLAIAVSGITKDLPRTSRYNLIWESVKTLKFGVAVAVAGLIIEISFLSIYLTGVNEIINRQFNFGLVLIAFHSVMLVLVFAAPIALNVKKWTGPGIISFVAFDLIAIGGYTMEVYFNIVWLKNGPELACLPCF